MDADRLARLTEQQRTCLRFVYAGMSSKAIAQRLGIEPGSVDQHLKAATRVLGVSGRHPAARLLVESERESGAETASDLPVDDAPSDARITSGEFLNERQAPFATLVHSARGPGLPLPIRGAKPQDLNPTQRLFWIVASAIAIALAFGVLLSAIEAFVRLVR